MRLLSVLAVAAMYSLLFDEQVVAQSGRSNTYVLFETDRKAKAHPNEWCGVPIGAGYIIDNDARNRTRCFVASSDGRKIPKSAGTRKEYYPDFLPSIWRNNAPRNGATIKVPTTNANRGLFFLHPVHPTGYVMKTGNRDAILPYLDIIPGKINYIGSFSLSGGKWNYESRPEGLRTILNSVGIKVSSSRLHVVKPRTVSRECSRRSGGFGRSRVCQIRLLKGQFHSGRLQVN